MCFGGRCAGGGGGGARPTGRRGCRRSRIGCSPGSGGSRWRWRCWPRRSAAAPGLGGHRHRFGRWEEAFGQHPYANAFKAMQIATTTLADELYQALLGLAVFPRTPGSRSRDRPLLGPHPRPHRRRHRGRGRAVGRGGAAATSGRAHRLSRPAVRLPAAARPSPRELHTALVDGLPRSAPDRGRARGESSAGGAGWWRLPPGTYIGIIWSVIYVVRVCTRSCGPRSPIRPIWPDGWLRRACTRRRPTLRRRARLSGRRRGDVVARLVGPPCSPVAPPARLEGWPERCGGRRSRPGYAPTPRAVSTGSNRTGSTPCCPCRACGFAGGSPHRPPLSIRVLTGAHQRCAGGGVVAGRGAAGQRRRRRDGAGVGGGVGAAAAHPDRPHRPGVGGGVVAGRVRLVSGGGDRTVRVWDAGVGAAAAHPDRPHRRGADGGVVAGRVAAGQRRRRQDGAGVGRGVGAAACTP